MQVKGLLLNLIEQPLAAPNSKPLAGQIPDIDQKGMKL